MLNNQELAQAPSPSTELGENSSSGSEVEQVAAGAVVTRTSEGSFALEHILFFVSGLGSSIAYIATLSSLVHFKLLYGANSFVELNLAIYLPLLPISLAQARWDQYYDVKYRSRWSFLVRGGVGFGLLLSGTIAMACQASTSSSSLEQLILQALLQGTGGAILYGTLNQLASFCGGTDADTGSEISSSGLKATVSAGVQSSALIVLLVGYLSGFGTHNANRFPAFLWSISSLILLCFAMFLWLILARPSVQASMIRRDSSLGLDCLDNRASILPAGSRTDTSPSMITPLLMDNEEDEETTPFEEQDAPSTSVNSIDRLPPLQELSFRELLMVTQICCLVLFGTLLPSFLVGSWFTLLNTDWMNLAQILFYVRIGSDFVGRLATMLVPPRNLGSLSMACLLRWIPVSLFFWNGHRQQHSDVLSIGLVAMIAFGSGYLVTGCFQLAPQALPMESRQANVAKQASLLTVAFAVPAVGGLVSSFLIMTTRERRS